MRYSGFCRKPGFASAGEGYEQSCVFQEVIVCGYVFLLLSPFCFTFFVMVLLCPLPARLHLEISGNSAFPVIVPTLSPGYSELSPPLRWSSVSAGLVSRSTLSRA